MNVHRLEREQWIPAPLERVFPFFADAANLETLTPPWLGFGFVTALPIEMRTGARIEYRLRLAGVPLRWRTRIAKWEPPRGFVDVQESGPYALWEHTHAFEPCGGGVLMRDVVRYALPLGPLGGVAHAVAVKAALAAIFDYRFDRVREIFAAPAAAGRAA
ncbi:MAG: CDP-paratose 2-epimerase [Proteobacteria bacterium]|nr:MAG: CDP-paratose 2-epimerase [Pseudomonadota bacterium]